MCISAIYWARLGRIYLRTTGTTRRSYDFLYHQIPLPLDQRANLIKPLLRTEAWIAFEEWDREPDKITY